MLVFIIDINSENIKEEYNALCDELKVYNELLLEKPRILLLSKIDIRNEKKNNFSEIPDIDILKISSVSNKGLQESIHKIYQKLQSI